MGRDIGKLAEATLEAWAAQVSITANRAQNDREGWDYILQFPLENVSTGTPLDLRPSRPECLVQVKGSESKRQRKSIGLQNWEKLTKSPLPAFFLVLEFEHSNEPSNAYLIHAGEEWMSRVLKRLREIPEAEKVLQHKKTLDLTWSESNRLNSLDGEGLRAAILHQIGDSFEGYVINKQNLLKELGSNVPFVLHFTTEPFENIDDLMNLWVDFAIGKVDTIPASKVIIDKNPRFGIPTERVEQEGGSVTVVDRSKTGIPVELVIQNNSGSIKAIFPAKLFTPDHFFPNKPVPNKYRRVRIHSEIGDIIFNPSAREKWASITFNIPHSEEPRKLSDITNLWRLIKIFHLVEREGCTLSIRDGVNPIFSMQIIDPPVIAREQLFIAQMVDMAWFIAKIFDIPPETEINLIELLQQNQTIKEIYAMCGPEFTVNAIEGGVWSDTIDDSNNYAVVILQHLIFGNLVLFICVGFTGDLVFERTEEYLRFTMASPKRIYLNHQTSETLLKGSESKLLTNAVDHLESRGYKVITVEESSKE